MTDNTQELDEILKEIREASWSMGLQNAPLCQLHNPRNNNRATDKAKQAILDWHNKQMSELLDRLAIEVRASDYIGIAETIQSERNKLTMANSPQLDKLKERDDENIIHT